MKILLVALSMLSSGIGASGPSEHDGHQLGTVSFSISCNKEAQARFTRGVAWLHSFEYEEAERAFLDAAQADPQCAMSHWGVAMSNYHPLWAPPTEAELAKGKGALQKAKAIGARTSRERDYIDALALFYKDPDRSDHGARMLAYTAAMEQLYRRYPSDHEAATFYALALVAAGTMDKDEHYAREAEAAAILNKVLAQEPDHPGVVHYLIHGYDYPALAHHALEAARRYADIAPASAHAQHMPSHIFTRLGLWDEVIRSNLASEAAAKAYAASHGLAGAWDEQLHAIDYLAYGYLQLGQDEKARSVLAALNGIARVDPPTFKVALAMSAVPARFALERRQWDEAAALTLSPHNLAAVNWTRFPWAEAQVHFARAVGAARTGKIDLARREIARLEEIREALTARPGEYDWGNQVEIERRIAAGWLAATEKRTEEALALMRSAAELDDASEKHPVTPGAILPAREQYGALLLELGRPKEALTELETALHRAPGRFNATRDAAQAASRAGDMAKAGSYYSALLKLCQPATCARPELAEATGFLKNMTGQ